MRGNVGDLNGSDVANRNRQLSALAIFWFPFSGIWVLQRLFIQIVNRVSHQNRLFCPRISHMEGLNSIPILNLGMHPPHTS